MMPLPNNKEMRSKRRAGVPSAEQTIRRKRKRPGLIRRQILRHWPALLGVRTLCRLRPEPLIDPQHRVVVIWSPKSACTATTIWFFRLAGLYDEALDYDSWPHQYRQNVYRGSELHRRGLADDLRGYRVIRVIRDPYQRAVSSYRHALMTGHLNGPMSAHLGRAVDNESGFSLADFLACIGRRDLSVYVSNTHHAVQSHPVERVIAPTDVINVSKQDLFEELNRIEAELGVERTDFETLSWFQTTEKGARRRNTGEFGGDVAETVFTRRDAGRGPWPETASFLTDAVRARIRRLYAADFDAYAPYL